LVTSRSIVFPESRPRGPEDDIVDISGMIADDARNRAARARLVDSRNDDAGGKL
jgi:hypothetical protein